MGTFFRDWRRRRILEKHPIPDALFEKGLELVPLLDDLTDEQVVKLRDLVTVFLHDKQFEGANGFVVDDAVKIVIGCLCCLVVLELDVDAYRGWSSIIVYQGEFKTRHEHVDEAGVTHVDERPQSGESAADGGIVVSWADVVESVEDPYHGYNVVIHECAHKLDMLSGGEAEGQPPLHPGMDRDEWARVFHRAYEHFCWEVDHGSDTRIDEDAAESKGEFFAVVSEAFFEAPDVLDEEDPEIYQQLQRFYKQDPLTRMPPVDEEGEHRPEEVN